MNHPDLAILGPCKPAPVQKLNDEPTDADQRFFDKRTRTIKSWEKRRMFNPLETWVNAATDEDKVVMVLQRGTP